MPLEKWKRRQGDFAHRRYYSSRSRPRLGQLYVQLSKLDSSSGEKVKQMADQIKDVSFNRLYNAFRRVVKNHAGERVQLSADRYIQAIQGTLFTT